MRLFIAVDLPEELSEYCFLMQKQLLFGNGIFSRTKHFHCTLKFLGEIEEENISDVIDKLSKIRFERFDVILSRPGVFPDDKTPKVLWLGLEKADKLIELQKEVEEALKVFEIKNDHKEFTPHITLARIQKIRDKNHFREKLKKFEKHKFEINRFTLYRSELLHTGPVYTKIKEFEALPL